MAFSSSTTKMRSFMRAPLALHYARGGARHTQQAWVIKSALSTLVPVRARMWATHARDDRRRRQTIYSCSRRDHPVESEIREVPHLFCKALSPACRRLCLRYRPCRWRAHRRRRPSAHDRQCLRQNRRCARYHGRKPARYRCDQCPRHGQRRHRLLWARRR